MNLKRANKTEFQKNFDMGMSKFYKGKSIVTGLNFSETELISESPVFCFTKYGGSIELFDTL